MLNRPNTLFNRIAKPVLGFGLVFAVLVLLVQIVLQEKNLTRELQGRAELLAATYQALLTQSEPQSALERLISLRQGDVLVTQLGVLDTRSGRYLYSTPDDWSGQSMEEAGNLARLEPGRQTWWLRGSALQSIVVPMSTGDPAKTVSLVAILDGRQVVAGLGATLRAIVITTLGGVLLLALGAYALVRTQVLRPIDAIRHAVEQRRQGAFSPIPKLRDDEIGSLAELLEFSLVERERLDDQLKLMSQAIQGSRNEVYIIDADDLSIHLANRTAQRNLGYTREELLQIQVPVVAQELQDAQYLDELAAKLQANMELTQRYTHTRKDGSEYPFEFTAMLVVQNERSWIIVLGNDVSEKFAQEEALRLSEERLNLAVQGSNDGVFDYDLEQGELYLSERVRGWLDYDDCPVSSQQERIDWAVARIHSDDMPAVRIAVHQCVQAGEEFDLEFRFRGGRGGYRWLQVRGRSLGSEGREARRITGFVSDITRRKVAEILLKDTVTRLGAVLDNITDGIVTLNVDGEVCAINPACEQMLSCDRDTLISQPFRDRLAIEPVGWEELADRQLRECVAIRGEGELFPAEFAVTRLEAGSDERFIVVFRDISQRKRTEDELHEAVARAEAATRAKGDFLATMSHEIRTPMNGVLGMTQLLLDMRLSEEQRETAEIIHASGEALLTIINDILDFSKIESGKLRFETIPFDLRTAVREVMDLLGANRPQLELYIDYPATVPGHLLGDLGRIRQVLMNLIGNAVKFTDAGNVVVRVEDLQSDVTPSDSSMRTFARLKVTVADSGCGISASAQEHLFNSFTQADASTTRKHGGTGLGLAISRRLVDLMGGEIGFTSTEGVGSQFWFTLNLPTYHEDSPVVPAVLSGQPLLLVNGNETGRAIYTAALRDAGMKVEAVDGVTGALERLGAGHYRFVLIDQTLADGDGFELAVECRQRWPACKIVMTLSNETRGAAIDRAVIDGRAIRPVLPGTLVILLNDLITRPIERREFVSATEDAAVARPAGAQRVLLAEDNVINQKVAVRMLEKLGCQVDVAANGQEAVDLWEQRSYSIIFMDCQMPEVDGLEATRQIRQLEMLDGVRTPIVAMTANAMARDEQNCRAAGMDDYLSKPVKTDQLKSVLSRWCEDSGSGSG